MGPITLTPDQLQTLAQAQKILHDVLPAIDGLESCGVDCQAMRAANANTRAEIDNLYAKFGGLPSVQSKS